LVQTKGFLVHVTPHEHRFRLARFDFYTSIYIPGFAAVLKVHLKEISMAQDVFAKHGELLAELKVNPNNGLGDLYDKIKGHPLQETIEKDIQVCTVSCSDF
jgi:hypothetical protein